MSHTRRLNLDSLLRLPASRVVVTSKSTSPRFRGSPRRGTRTRSWRRPRCSCHCPPLFRSAAPVLGSHRINDAGHLGDPIRRKATPLCAFPDKVLVLRDVDAVDLVSGDIALDPLYLWTSSLKTLHDFCEMALRSETESLPAPGNSRSITYFGMIAARSITGDAHRRAGAHYAAFRKAATYPPTTNAGSRRVRSSV